MVYSIVCGIYLGLKVVPYHDFGLIYVLCWPRGVCCGTIGVEMIFCWPGQTIRCERTIIDPSLPRASKGPYLRSMPYII